MSNGIVLPRHRKMLDEAHKQIAAKVELPRIAFEYFPRGVDDKEPHRAHIQCACSEHHGIGATPAEALLNAATHWRNYEKALAQDEAAE